MILSKRLEAVASMVTEGHRLADIGTDHAFVPIWLVEKGSIPSAIAMDVNKGPLERAQEHICAYGLEDRIETRLSDGLERLGQDEADTVLIAGMGGALTVRILERRPDLACEIRELILQPQSEIALVRRYLERTGWKITDEKMILEDGKYYQMMRCVPGRMTLTDAEAQYGPCLIREADEVWTSFLRWQEGILKQNLSQLEKAAGERGESRRSEIKQQLAMVCKLLDMQ